MKRLMLSSLLLCAFCFSASSPKREPIYVNISQAMKKCGDDSDALQRIISISYKIAKGMGGAFVNYWEPKAGTKFHDITPQVISEFKKR